MKSFRFSLFWLFVFVGVFAVFFAAIKQGTHLWLQIAFMITLSAILGAALGAIWSSGQRRAFLIGFLVFGGSYFLLVLGIFFGGNSITLLLSNSMLDVLQFPALGTPANRISIGNITISPARYVVHFGSSLVFGFVGGMVGSALSSRRGNPTE